MKKGLHGVILGIILLFPFRCFGQLAAPKPGETAKTSTPLEFGQTIESEIAPGQKHSYKVRLTAGQFASIEADQRGCDIVFSFLSPEGQNLLVITNETVGDGIERATPAVAKTGEYELRVISMHGAEKSGTYSLRIADVRPATAKELSFTEGIRLFNEAFNLTRENATADSINSGISKLVESAAQLHLADNPMREGIALRNIGDLYDRLGNRLLGIEFKNAALERFQTAKYKYGEFWVFRDFGKTYLEAGDIEKSLDSFLKAVALFPELQHPGDKAETLNSLGKLYERTGDLQRAGVYYTQALPFATEEQDLIPIHVAVTNNNLGQICWLSGDIQKAGAYFQRAFEISRASNNRPREASFLINLSKVQSALGNRDKALDQLQESLEISRSMGNKLGEATALKSIGQLVLTMGDTARSLEALDQALQIYRVLEDNQDLADTLLTLAKAETKNGDLANAQTRTEEAIRVIETVRSRLSVGDLRDSFSSNLQDFYSFYVELLMRRHEQEPDKNFAALALQANERAHARGLMNLLAESNVNIREGVDPDLLQKETGLKDLLAARLENLTRALNGRTKREDIEKLKVEIERLRAEHDKAQADVRQTSPHYADLTQPKTLDLAEIQTKVVDGDSVLLEYAMGETKSYLWIVTADKFRSVELPGRAVIESSARRFYDTLTARNQDVKFETDQERDARIAQADARVKEYSADLSRTVLRPAMPFLANKRVLVVADGALQYIPFSALVVSDARPEIRKSASSGSPGTVSSPPFLIESNEVVNLPSASVLSVLRKETSGRPMSAKTLAVLADPVFDESDERVRDARSKNKPNTNVEFITVAKKQTRGFGASDTRGLFELSRLPYTRREADLITSMVPARQQEKLLDFAASRTSAMSDDLSRFRFVHFATHGFINNENPELSGIALSMFDESGAERDGFLRVGDIYNLKLPAEMVVLSGCKTGLGKEIRGEGLVGLTRGFIYAGAKRVTVSLWDVNDEATADLMGRFYREMLGEKGLQPAAALRNAQIAMIKERRWQSPYFWSAFILTGEPK